MSDSPRFDVIGIGGCAWDLLGTVRRYPEPGQKVPLLQQRAEGGGQAATALVAVARLGGRAALLGTVGDDEYGEKIRAGLAAEGVDLSHLILDPGKTSHWAFCAVQEGTGEREIFFCTGTKRKLTPADVAPEFVRSGRCLLMDTHHWEASVRAAEIARAAGLPVITDLEHPGPTVERLLHLGTHHVMPEHFLLEHTGETDPERAAAALLATYAPEVLVVTRGVRGCVGYEAGDRVEQAAYRVEPTVDTTGAGDVFHGAFAYGLTLGYDLPRNLAFASLVAGLKCRALGGRSGIPRREELGQWWARG